MCLVLVFELIPMPYFKDMTLIDPFLVSCTISIGICFRLEENEKLVLTPFEKNLDIWRQLWRVVERSDLVSFVLSF